MGKRLPDDRYGAPSPAPGQNPACFECNSSEHGRAHQERLLKDEHKGCRNNVTRVAAYWIEQRLGQELDR